MHLNRALVSTFLFVSAVLAREPNDMAGVVRIKDYETKTLMNVASGTFTVPHIQGTIGSGVVIGIGLDGLRCLSASLAAGIQIMMYANGPYVGAWAEFLPRQRVWQLPSPEPFIISLGDRITVTVGHENSVTKGFFELKNLDTEGQWSGTLDSQHENPLCGNTAFWVVEIVPNGGITPLASFQDVVFTDLWYQINAKRYRFHKKDIQERNVLTIRQGNGPNNVRTLLEVQEGESSAKVIVKSLGYMG